MKATRKTNIKIFILFGLILCGVIFSFYGLKKNEATSIDVTGWDIEPYNHYTVLNSMNDVHISNTGSKFYVKDLNNGTIEIACTKSGISGLEVYGGEHYDTVSLSISNPQVGQTYTFTDFPSDLNELVDPCLSCINVHILSDCNLIAGEKHVSNGSIICGGGEKVEVLGDYVLHVNKQSGFKYYLVKTSSPQEYYYNTLPTSAGVVEITSLIDENGCYSIPEGTTSGDYAVFCCDTAFPRMVFNKIVLSDCDRTCPVVDNQWIIDPIKNESGMVYFSESSFEGKDTQNPIELLSITYSDNIKLSHRLFDTGIEQISQTHSDISSDGLRASSTLSIKPGNVDFSGTILFTVDDWVGNNVEYPFNICYDCTAPSISNIKLNNIAYSNSKKLFNEDLTVSFDVVDETISSVQVYIGNIPTSITRNGNTYSFTLTDEFRNKIKIVARDVVGHETVYTTDVLEIDKTPLDVTSASLNNNDILNNSIYVATKTCNFSVRPDNTDVKKISVSATTGEGESAVTHSVDLAASNGNYVGSIDLDDGAYEFSVNLEDKAGNTSTVPLKKFTVDTSAPLLLCSQDKTLFSFMLVEKNLDSNNIGDATLTCQDLFKNIEDITVKINGEETNGSLAVIKSLLTQKSNWKAVEGSPDTYKLDFEVITDGSYDFSVEIADLAGNKSQKITKQICHDTKEPDFTKASFDVERREFKDYGYIANKTIGLEIIGSDEVSGIKEVYVSYTDNNGNAVKGTCELKEGTTDTFLYFFGKKDCEKGLIDTITLTDNSDNTRVVDFKNGVIIDKETADVELLNLDISDNVNGREVLNEDLDLTLSIKDNYSGIGSYNYTLNGKKKEGSGDRQQIEYEKVIKDKIIASQNEGDDIVVELSATDNAGNSKKIEKKYSFDTTKPTIKVTYDSTTDNNYYKVTRTATVTIIDEHFSEKGVVFAVTNNGNKVSVSPKFTTNDGKTFTATVPFSEEGIYAVGLTATDRAGNKSVFTDGTLFTIDKTAPKMSVSYDDSRASNGKYFNNTRVATVLVDELNFDDSLVKVNVGATGEGRAPQLSSFSNSLTHHTANLSFSVDGNYTITGSVTDKAGNVSEEVTSPEFVIDTKQPEISFSGVEEGRSYNGDIAPVCSVTDTNYDSGEVVANGVKYGQHNELNINNNKTKEGETFTYSVFTKQLGTDDAYTIRATARDLAGNTQEKSISFKVNRFGSRYSLDEYTTEAAEKYYVNSDKNFVIIEDNLDKVSNYELCYVSDGATKVLDYDKNYTVSSSVDNSGWNSYSYSIKPDMLEKDGVYSFVVYSTDAAGNKSDNITKGTPLQVCVDDTAPVITVANLEDTGVYRVKNLKAKVIVTDNIAYDKSIVKLNEKEYDVTESDFDIDINESKEEQTLEVMSIDKAGNAVTTDIYTFLVDSTASENAKVESRRGNKKSMPMPVIVLCGVLGTGFVGTGAAFGVIAFRKRKVKK